MTRRRLWALLLVLPLMAVTVTAVAGEPTAAQRGEKALLGRSFSPPTIPVAAYRDAWRLWGLKEPPAPERYTEAVMEHYGLHPAPYPNNGYPMGVRESQTLLGRALSTDCLLCHGGSVFGTSYVGLGNSSLDIQAFFADMAAVDGRPAKTPFRFSNVRGTSEAGGFAVYLLGLREPDLRVRARRIELGLHDDLCEDAPAWWLLKKKKTMYHNGSGDARSVRSLMQFMLSPLNPPEVFEREEATFRDIQAYLLSLQPPKYPLPIDSALAKRGEQLFNDTCARCHGTYGLSGTYPNKIVPLDVIGTDRRRFDGITREFGEYYNQSWFAQDKLAGSAGGYKALASDGYQAPPLDGVWATAPYFHNGAAPTVYHVLNSKARPRIFTRSYRTDQTAYDAVRLGWKVEVLEQGAGPDLPPYEARKIYDTRLPGRSNGGHTFGDRLTDEERMAVIEYLKTL